MEVLSRQHSTVRDGSGHVALDEGNVAVFALRHCPLLHRLIENLVGEAVCIVQHYGARRPLLVHHHCYQRWFLPSASLVTFPVPFNQDGVWTRKGILGFDASHGTFEDAAAKFSSTACLGTLEMVSSVVAVLLLLASGCSSFKGTERLLECFFTSGEICQNSVSYKWNTQLAILSELRGELDLLQKLVEPTVHGTRKTFCLLVTSIYYNY